MAIKSFNPTTPSTRSLVLVDKSSLWKGKPCKKLVRGLRSKSGRNSYGRITVRSLGGGCKRKYRLIDFKRHKTVVNAEVQSIEYDPNRSSFVALIKYDDGELSYIIAPEGLKVRDKVCSGLDIDPNLGNAMPLNKIAVGTQVHNVEMKIGKGGQIARAAGCYATVASKSSGYVLLKMRSGQTRLVHAECYATIGVVSNLDHKNISLGKAGRSRWMGRRPSVRGVAMNPVDHPHGGGEGKTSGGRHPVSPWGKPTKGAKTRKRRKFGSKLVANIKGGN